MAGAAPRVGAGAAARLGWDRWVGPEGAFVGMTGFGASGKEDDLWPHFAITAEAVAGAVRASLDPLPGRRAPATVAGSA